MNRRSETQRLPGGELAVNQGYVGDLHLTWNPDDERFYVSDSSGETLGTFARRDNAVTFARRKSST